MALGKLRRRLTGYTPKQLPGERLYVIPREWRKFVLLQEVVHTHAEQL